MPNANGKEKIMRTMNGWKLLAGAAAITVAGVVFSIGSANAKTFERCDEDGNHCVKIHCDSDGDECWQKSEYYIQTYYKFPGRWECETTGDTCHYIYTGHEWHPHWDTDK